ncbi:sulfotransferase domain-containing protein [Pleurocapsales cyanobacterium LEGE 10410]|nr:sulfotransferase domain-containing protein [Pleurocapsales cyanobacterium LEGE 10410]
MYKLKKLRAIALDAITLQSCCRGKLFNMFRKTLSVVTANPKKVESNYNNELKLFNGESLSKNEQKSILFFTIHKCASTYMQKCMKYINEKYLNLNYVNLEGYVYQNFDCNIYQLINQEKQNLFYQKGNLYSPLRKYIPVKEIERYHVLLMLRDPRDVIVSNYFSTAYSHSLPPRKNQKRIFLERRLNLQKLTIDEYAIQSAHHFYQRYSDYCNYLIKERNVQHLKYEDFVEDFNLWLQKLERTLKLNISKKDLWGRQQS